ncbi:protein artichoke-like [Pectinophora gossypiella]|uniref:protein artichoke-like n=1 Tax=Pectinophora gossypiella TaxID=13191 RepID=UPI00214F1A68|nr:protein artichoke-like [Pectinophora gossypiella]
MRMFGALFVIMILAFRVHIGEGYCVAKEEKPCTIKINCDNNIFDLYNNIETCFCIRNYGWGSTLTLIDLTFQNVDLDEEWHSLKNYRNDIDNYVNRLSLANINNIPNQMTAYSNLKEINIVKSKLQKLNMDIFLNLHQLHIINVTQNILLSSLENTNIIVIDNSRSNVETIDLSHNAIAALPNNCFSNFPQLKHLHISHNFISNFNILTFEGMSSLITLDVSHNTLIEIGHNFARFINLREISLGHNNLTSILETNFKMMTEIEKIDLNSNQLQVIEEDAFETLVNLEEIDLSYNRITKICRMTFHNNAKLHKILLSDNNIDNIDHEAFIGKHVSTFNINNNCLTGVVEMHSFDGISTDILDLSGSKITSLDPEAFSGLQTRVLNLSTNILSEVSVTSFKSVHSLEDLDLSNNKLRNINFDISDLTELSSFSARNNTITNISTSFFTQLVSLTKLDLSFNKIPHLDDQLLSRLRKLEFLDISHNNVLKNKLHSRTFEGLFSVTNIQITNTRITSFENGTFSHLSFLKIINASHGELASLGFETFKDSGSIEILDLSNNLLENFFVNGTSIASVAELYLYGNKIKNITSEPFSHLVHLKKLNLANNNIARFDPKLFPSITKLVVLDLSSNTGIDYTGTFDYLAQLYELSLANVDKQFDFEHVINKIIKNLDLSCNNIDNLNSMFISNIQNVESLNLKSNKIPSINKLSFQNMQQLTYLDLSFNLISFIQPGSFLHTNNIRYLNLHNNALTSLQVSVFEGLSHLETLNLSNNALREFGNNVLHNIPHVKTIALDNNDIENIQFKDFAFSEIHEVYLGNNPIYCHTLIEFKQNKINLPGYRFNVLAESLDFYHENVDGVTCKSGDVNSSIVWTESKGHLNETAAILAIAKAIESLRDFKDKSRALVFNDTLLKTTIDILKSMDSHLIKNTNMTNVHFSSIEEQLRKITRKTENSMKINVNGTTGEHYYYIEEKIQALMDEQKRNEKNIEQFQEMLQNLQNELYKNQLGTRTVKGESNEDGVKGLLYFISVMITVLLVMIGAIMLYKYVKAKSIFGVSRLRGSTQPSSIELQNS